jgi:hypothetical protein
VNKSANNELNNFDVTMPFECTVQGRHYKQFYNLKTDCNHMQTCNNNDNKKLDNSKCQQYSAKKTIGTLRNSTELH